MKVFIIALMMLGGFYLFGQEQQAQVEKKEAAMKKILVVYYTRTQITEGVAKDIAQKLNADIEAITEKDKDRSGLFGYLRAGWEASQCKASEINTPTKNPQDYDLVIIGTPIWAWKMTPAVRAYISSYKDKIKKVAFFTTAGGTAADDIVKAMEELSGKKPEAWASFVRKELKDKAVYDEKIKKFVDTLK